MSKENRCDCGAQGNIPCNYCVHDYFGECTKGNLAQVLDNAKYGCDQYCKEFTCDCES